MRFNVKLDRLEKRASDGFPEALRGIVGVRYYDQLTDTQKALWVRYRWHTDVETFETVQALVAGTDFHFLCDRKPKPPTPQELQQAQIEIENYISKITKGTINEQV